MANTQINITDNGTTTLATADKYCDRNIDVNVDVHEKVTEFTNLYSSDYVTIDYKVGLSGSTVSFATDTECNCIKIPYHHMAGEPVVLRFRGIGTVRSRLPIVALASDGTTLAGGYEMTASSCNKSYDEHGDTMLTLIGTIETREWYYLCFNFQYLGVSSASSVLTGPIITINEPIGNGGYVG